jgi:hypothetical protein
MLVAASPLAACNLLLNFSSFDSEVGVIAASDASDAAALTCDAAALSSDPSNCGRCGHDCLGGVCLEMQCQPATLASVISGTATSSIALDTEHVYWSETPGIMAVLKDGGMPSTVASLPPGATVSDVAVDTSGVYWSVSSNLDGGTGVFRSAEGGTMSFQAGPATSLTLDVNNVYWTEAELEAVRRESKSGTGGVTDIVDYGTPASYVVGNIVLAAPLLYWTDALGWPNVSSAPILGCTSGPMDCGTSLVDAGTRAPNGLIVDDAGIFWSTSVSLNQTALDGGPSSSLYATTTAPIRALAADADEFYLAVGMPPQILSVSRGDRSVALVANLSTDELPMAIAVDEVAIYFVSVGITQGDIGTGDGGRVGIIAK